MSEYATLPSNIAKQLSKGVDMSKVTQAASQGNLSGQGYSNAAISSNPSTSISIAGKSPYPALTQYGQQNLQGMPVQGPSLPGGGGPSGSGPGGISVGSYEATKLSQDQRQWLWEQFGHKGPAPVGYGGESAAQQQVFAPQTPTLPPLPSFVPPPTPVQGTTMQPKSASGATSAPTSLSTGGGVAGQAFGALTQAGQALSGLGNISSIGNSLIKSLQSIPQGVSQAIGTFAPQFTSGAQATGSQTQGSTQQLKSYNPQADTGGAVDPLSAAREWAMSQPGSSIARNIAESIGPATNLAGLVTGARGLVKGGIGAAKSLIGGGAEEAGGFGSALKKGVGGLFAGLAGSLGEQAGERMGGTPVSEGTYNQQTRALTTPQGLPTNIASMQNLSGNVTDRGQTQQLASAVLSGQAKQSDVVPQIANQEGLSTVAQMLNQAVKTGDMGTVSRLASLHDAVSSQIQFINQIGQIVTALAAGFGTPNQAGVTEARLPMMEQGIGQALTSAPQPYYPYQQGVMSDQDIQRLPYQLPTMSQTQQNRPVLKPFMGSYG